MSNGKAEYGVVVSPHVSLATVNLRQTADDLAVATVFYKTNRTSAALQGAVFSGSQLRDEKLEVVPGDQILNVDHHRGKSFQCSGAIPAAVVSQAQHACRSCQTKENKLNLDSAPAASGKVVVILYEETNLFTDDSLMAKDNHLASPVLGMTVRGSNGVNVPLSSLAQNVTINFSIAHLQNVSHAQKHYDKETEKIASTDLQQC